MACKLATALCAALLLWATAYEALSPTKSDEQPSCLCSTFYNSPINRNMISELRLIESGSQCNSTEMLAKLVDKRELCLNPMKKWVKKIVYSYLKGLGMRLPQETSQ